MLKEASILTFGLYIELSCSNVWAMLDKRKETNKRPPDIKVVGSFGSEYLISSQLTTKLFEIISVKCLVITLNNKGSNMILDQETEKYFVGPKKLQVENSLNLHQNSHFQLLFPFWIYFLQLIQKFNKLCRLCTIASRSHDLCNFCTFQHGHTLKYTIYKVLVGPSTSILWASS